jgi:hypothetical protein
MDRVQEVLAFNNFLLFLASKKLYTNSSIYFKYLSLWITKASTSPSHHKQDYQRRALRLFDQYYQTFSSLLPSQLPSFRFSISPLFPKRNVYVGWPYMETKQQQQKTPTIKKSDLDLDVFLHSVTCLPIKNTNNHFIFNLGDTNDVMFSLTDFLDFNRAPEYKHFLYSKPHLRKCQSIQQNFAQMYDISKNFFILYDECLIFISNLVKMYIQSYWT